MIPAWNEEGSIANVVEKCKSAMPTASLLVVDDGSTDQTSLRAREFGATVIRHPINLGIGGAVQTGYLYALENDFDIAIQIDGDGQHDPEFIPALLNRMGEHDLMIGSRFISNIGFQSSKARRIGILFFSKLLYFFTGKFYTDPTSGFRVANRRVIEYFAENYPKDFPEVEVILSLHRDGFKIGEEPVVMHERTTGQSSINLRKSIWYMLKVSMLLCIGTVRRNP